MPSEPSKTPRHIGLLMFRQIGDVLLTTPAISVLRKHFPETRITAVVNDFTAPMIENNPCVNDIIVYKHQARALNFWRRALEEGRLIRKIRAAKFDLTIDFTGGDRPAICSWLSGASDRIASELHLGPWHWKTRAYNHPVPRPVSPLHQVQRHLLLLEPLGIRAEEPPLVLRLSEAELAWARGQKTATDGPIIAAHFVANWLFKCWEDEKVASLLDRMREECGWTVWFTSGPAKKETAKARQILELCHQPPQAWVGNISLRQLAALIAASDCFVGVDTAPMHMAAALQKPVVALFGPTPVKRWEPWCERKRVLGANCPCLQRGRLECDRNSVRKCLQAITVDEALAAVKEVLNKKT